MAITTIYIINLSLLYCWHRYNNMGCVFRPSDYSWINKKESAILLVATAIFTARLPIYIIFLVRPVSLTICRLLCLTCCIVQKDILYYKYNYKFPTCNQMTEIS